MYRSRLTMYLNMELPTNPRSFFSKPYPPSAYDSLSMWTVLKAF
jgi:hypothetical protein